MPYWAHFDKEKGTKQELQEHLRSVAGEARDRVTPNVKFKDIPLPTIKKIVYWMGYFHDLGKYTDYFQKYLTENKNSPYKNHAHISACCLYSFLLDRVLDLPGSMHKKVLAFIIYLCVRRHHGSLSLEGLFKITQEEEMWKSLQFTAKNLADKGQKILRDTGLSEEISVDEFKKYFKIDLLRKDKKHFKFMPQYLNSGRIQDEQWFFLLIYLFSLLIDTDKLDSGGLKPTKVKNISPTQVSKYLSKKRTERVSNAGTALLNRREQARTTMLGVIENLTDEEIKNTRFFTLTAPTGIGKTLSSLQCALRLQERIKKVENYTPRIITAIPFINIIEQNKKEYEHVFENKLQLVVHHRLGDFSKRASFREEIPIDKALLEVESWEGDVILTTFVQLFQSIFTGNNRLLKKINKLAGSIVILDEAQAIPEKYMPLIGAVLQKISEFWGTRFILMTATQPKILEFGNLLLETGSIKSKEVPLLPDYKKYFVNLKRTKFIPLLEKRLDNEEFLSLFQDKWDGKKSVLIVVNTIKRSIELYRKIKELLEISSCSIPVYYLSTNIIPLKRREVIRNVKDKLDKKKPVILVSTQTIEAGVDLDFDMAFRDLAPLDSLIQTAGRVNREGKKGENLPVYIVQLESDNHYVYELTHRKTTLELLTKSETIEESQYGCLADEYYSSALKRGVSDQSKELWEEGILKLNFEMLKEFQLIENAGETADVFVEKDFNAAVLADAYEKLLKKEPLDHNLADHLSKILEYPVIKSGSRLSIFEIKALIRLIQAKMNDYIVQVRVSRLKGNKLIEFKNRGEADSFMYWIPPEQIDEYYDEETGFVSETGEAFIF
ncbi:CRISPR-associated endonuclease/helicase Cas3 [Desulfohalotomaculum tongense]|uniref:CRISPR-associated helicase Cas3' n=1 Tax=Desulforadius tongensis TaxID=1216062 RepID=UPI00195EAA77|nr:CRISPR-associated helicase Cas3' [Desulforadius tongensis]MBM7854573.1 CRISPR-associated endonuclease/helicase Cas3 [Desulforadius tongensis]